MKKKSPVKTKSPLEELNASLVSAIMLAQHRGVPRMIVIQELIQIAGTALAVANSPIAYMLDHPGFWCGIVPEGVKLVKKEKGKP